MANTQNKGKRPYPQLSGIKDQPTSESIRLLWTKLNAHADSLDEFTALMEAARGDLSTVQSQLIALRNNVNQALVPSGSSLTNQILTTTPGTVSGGPSGGGGVHGENPNVPTNPTLPPPSAPPPGQEPPARGTLAHGFPLGTAAVYNSPADIATWPATATISKIIIQQGLGVSIEFSKHTGPGAWPNFIPLGWDGPLQYTVWVVVYVSGGWNTSGFIQMWDTRAGTGATPVGADFKNWAYDSRWGPMNGFSPPIGSTMGFFVSAGDARGQTGVTSIRERSEVVQLALPDANGMVYV